MPVFFNGKPLNSKIELTARGQSSSSNTCAISIDKGLVSHELDSLAPPRLVLKPIIDTVSLTITGKAAYGALLKKPLSAKMNGHTVDLKTWWAQTRERFTKAAKDQSNVHLAANNKRRMDGYRFHFDMILPGTDMRPLFSFPLAAPAKAPLRIELNASRLPQNGVEAIEQLWAQIAGSDIPFRALMPDARMTRIDVAVDLLNVRVANLYAHHPKVEKIWCCSSPVTGGETWYFYIKHFNQTSPNFSFKKPSNLSIYDKRAEQLANGVEPKYGAVPHARIELRHTTRPFPKNLPKWVSNFDQWMIVRAGLSGETEQIKERLALDSIRLRGFEQAKSLHDNLPSSPEELALKFPADVIPPNFNALVSEAIAKGPLGRFTEWGQTALPDLLGKSKKS